LNENNVFKKYEFTGTHREVGRQHGEALKSQILHHLDITYENAARVSNVTKERALSVAKQYEPYIRAVEPGFMEEIEGIAEGAGITKTEALLLQVRQEAVYLGLYGKGGFDPECTSYFAGPGYTSDGKVYAGQNADLAGDFESISNVVIFAVTGKPKVMMIVPAGQISYLGINSEGMGVDCNFLACDGWRKGFPRYLISRYAIEHPTFEEAAAAIRGIKERSSYTVPIRVDTL
jgi:isopenicillin-N N-acyltransferase-like protein